MSMYFVRAKSGRLFSEFLERGIVALGGLDALPDIGDLRQHLSSREILDARVRAWSPRPDGRSISYTTRVLWLLAGEMKAGDRVLTYDGKGSYALGEVVGDYRYEPAWDAGPLRCPHVRDVAWREEQIPKAALSPQTRRELGREDSVVGLPYAAGQEILERAGAA